MTEDTQNDSDRSLGTEKDNRMFFQKDYLRLFLKYAKDNSLWFSVFPSGEIDEVTECELGCDMSPAYATMLGTKEAYEWLIQEHNEISEN